MIQITSPLTKVTKPQPSELVELREWQTGLLHVRGKEAEQVLNSASMVVGDVRETSEGLLARLRHNEFVLLTDDIHNAITHITKQISEQHVTVTDVTHGFCNLRLIGKGVPTVLTKVCALDFADRKFPHHHAAQTSLAKVRTLIIRNDIHEAPAYHIIVDRSLAAYVWDVVADAAEHL